MAKRRSWQNGSKALNSITNLPNNRLPEVVVKGIAKDVIKDFMPIVQERLKARLPEFNVGDSGGLESSFRWQVRSGTYGVTGELRFNFYGRFVDMGVGKGMSLAEQQTGRAGTSSRTSFSTGRKPKPWFMPQYLHEIDQLQKIITEELNLIATEIGTPAPESVIVNI